MEREMLASPFEDGNASYLVLINEEKQCSLWPDFREIPPGWKAVGPHGSRKECLQWVEDNWTDMRPASLVYQMNHEAGHS